MFIDKYCAVMTLNQLLLQLIERFGNMVRMHANNCLLLMYCRLNKISINYL